MQPATLSRDRLPLAPTAPSLPSDRPGPLEPPGAHAPPPEPAAAAATPGTQATGPLSERERRSLLCLARAVMPARSDLRGADAATVERLVGWLREAPGAASGYRGLLLALDALAWMRFRSRLADLDPSAAMALCRSLNEGDFAARSLLRAVLAPLKLAHFDDAGLYAQFEAPYPRAEAELVPPHLRPAAPPELPRYAHERTQRAVDLAPGEVIDCDVVVIGSGAGGAVAAYELAAAGHAVVLLEEGAYNGRRDFVGSSLRRVQLMYRDTSATFALGNTVIPLPVGRGVGGTTAINSGTCFRAPDRIFRAWQEHLGLTRYSPESMAPFYERVEGVLGVGPTAASLIGRGAERVAEACAHLGWKHRPLLRNAPECDGQGVCCFGCPTDAKRSTNVSYVPMALRAGCQLITLARAERLLVQGGRAVGVEAVASSAPPGQRPPRFRIQSRAVVVACGALMTPVLLLSDERARRALGRSGALGNNLSIHPAGGVLALMPEAVRGYRSVPQGYAIEQFHDEGLLMEGAFMPLDLTAVSVPLIGPELMEVMAAYDRLACFGFMLEDEGRGRVRPGPGRRPLVRYDLSPADVLRARRGFELLGRLYFAAGAERVLCGVRGFEDLRSLDDVSRLAQAPIRARDMELTAYHPLGSARMSRSGRDGVVDEELQAHDLPGLYICDGSVLPTSPGVNPQVTIMALASRAAQHLAERLS
ncbi:MAG: GMC family oxidoreductase [Polyangia bacterium]